MEIKKLNVDGKDYYAFVMDTENTKILIIKAKKGVLGCGYIDASIGTKVNDAVAIVTGVKSFEDMLNAKVARLSEKAKSLGIAEGMSGREAIKKLS